VRFGPGASYRESAAKPFGEVMKQILRAKRFYEKAKYGALADAWLHVAGEEIASRTRIRGYKNGRLAVEVSSPVLMHELTGFLRAAFLERLRQMPGGQDLVEIRFQLGERAKD